MLGALLELDIGYCEKIDCKNALEVLPTMPWAATIQKLDLGCSNAEGKFEDFKALGALLELSIGGCRNIDCKKAIEVLPTMPWAAQIQKLDLTFTDVEGTAECSFVFGAPVRSS